MRLLAIMCVLAACGSPRSAAPAKAAEVHGMISVGAKIDPALPRTGTLAL
jgi:hypothetical protein